MAAVRAGMLALLFLVQDSFPSGPQVGDKLTEFKVLGFSGPQEGKEFEVLGQAKGKPMLLIFVHKITRPALRFLRPVDERGAREETLASHVVWLSEDRDKTLDFLKRASKSLNLQAPMSISVDGKDGPAAYGLNDKVTLTVVLAKEGKVVANFALVDPNEKDAPKVLAAIEQLAGKK